MSAEYAAQFRARPEQLALAPVSAADQWLIRVQVAEAWDAVRMTVAPDTPVATVKQAALAAIMSDARDVDAYEVKLHGELVDERHSLQQAGARNGSILLVIGRRRRPVR